MLSTVTAVLGTAVAVLSVAAQDWSPLGEHPVGFLLLAALVLAGETRPIAVSRGDDVDYVTLSLPFLLPILAVGGLGLAVLTLLAASLLDDALSRRGVRTVAFNAGQYVLSLAAAWVAFALLAGIPLGGGPVEMRAGLVLPLLASGVVFVVVNQCLVAAAVAVTTEQPFSRAVVQDLRFTVTVQVMLVAVAPLAAIGLQAGSVFIALLAVPVVVLHRIAAEVTRREQEALHDGLTGLGNRELLRGRLQRGLHHAEEAGGGGPGLVLLDLDHFKDVNDTLGHPVGDELLRQVAKRLVATVGDSGMVARLGGDEFAVVVPGPIDEAEQVARTLLDAFDEAVLVGDLRLLVRASAGIAAAPQHGTSPSELMKNADVALYDAKGERGRWATYSPDHDVNSVDRLQLIDDLRTALDADALGVAFQPQVRVADGRTVGVEALVRWRHPARGDVPPDVFVPLAENAGMIPRLTAFVLDVALAELARWAADGHEVRLAVNVAARQLSDLALPPLVADTLKRHGVPAENLVIEVTETGILSDPVRVDVVVRELRRLGVGIAVDDYGTGNASLSYLKRLDVDELKIDKTFVVDMARRPEDFIIVRSTVSMARELGLRVVAEGVEDAATSDALSAVGCDTVQGFFHGRPAPGPQVLERLRAEADAARAGGSAEVH
ncbi:putative bifunctional diguanylate cyclase/phosphodiesterase [Aquipuribacter nitratireducens]|uniref:Bifunctional diguanylate cyclase/phosphodiesterase n=1 Tax=Aquipuribacter nitratireducens TaxID=650104 RepID=A0ABW0GR26_9MICO